MTTNSPSATGRSDDVSDRSEQKTLARTVGASLATLDWKGVVAGAAGGALLIRGLRTVGERRASGLLQVVAGAALVAFGVSRRGSDDEPRDRGADVSDDAHAELERPDTESNPRDVTDDPDAAQSSEDEGEIQYTADQTDDLDGGPGEGDADGSDRDDGVEVDISEAAVADEPGEAAGPTSAQAEPTTTKTDLSPPSDVEEPEVEGGIGDGSDEDRDDETVETEGGAEVHTDTMESGTMDVDEEDVTDESGEPIGDSEVEELSDDEAADYQVSDGGEETEETEGGAEVHTDTNEAGTMDVDEEDVDEGDTADEDDADEDDADEDADEAR